MPRSEAAGFFRAIEFDFNAFFGAFVDVLPLIHHQHELLVHLVSVLGHQAEVLDVHVLEQRVHLDALHDHNDLSVKFAVRLVKLRVGLLELKILLEGNLEFLAVGLISCLQLRKFDLKFQQLFAVVASFLGGSIRLLIESLLVLLERSLLIQLFFG